MHDEPGSSPAASSRKKMAIQLYEHSQTEQQAQAYTLYCEEDEEQWEEEEEEEDGVIVLDQGENLKDLSSSVSVSQHDLFWEEEELVYLFSKEAADAHINNGSDDPAFILARGGAIEWILKVVGHYGFTPLTTILAINYLNRFLLGIQFQGEENPWTTQLVAVACLSLAAKVEETQVPFLLDLQVGDAEFLFDAKTVLKMELLVLSTLQWRMNPVTPFSFLDHIMRRLWSKNGRLQWDFRRRCERLLVSLVSDWKSLGYKPSVLAAATMVEVIDEVEPPWKAVEYQEQLLGVLKISQDEVNDCWELIRTLLSTTVSQKKKRKHDGEYEQEILAASPNGVIDAAAAGTCDDSSNDSWAVAVAVDSSSVPFVKKMRKNN